MLAGSFFSYWTWTWTWVFEEDLDSDLDLPTYRGLGLGLEDSGLGLGLDCCWTCYTSGRVQQETIKWLLGFIWKLLFCLA